MMQKHDLISRNYGVITVTLQTELTQWEENMWKLFTFITS